MSDQQAEKDQQLLSIQRESRDCQSLPRLLEKAKDLGFSDAEITKLKTMYGSHFVKGNA